MSRVRRQENALKIHDAPAPPAYLVLSNFPFRFDLEGTRIPRGALLEGFKIPRLVPGAPFASLRELSEFHAERADPLRFAKTFKEMQIPSPLDGALPSKAFGEKGVPILIGERYLVPDEQGREVAGELVSAVMMESENSVMATMRLNDGIHINISMPISDQELDIYRQSPETFFGAYEPATKIEQPVDMYEFVLSVYKDTPRERLLEFMADHPHVDQFRSLPQSELAKIFC